MLNDSAVSAQAVLTREKHRHRAEITLHARGEKFLHGVGDTGEWETSLSEAVEKLNQQALKVKGKWNGRKRRGKPAKAMDFSEGPVAPAENPVRRPRVVKASRYPIKPMSVAEAAMQVDARKDSFLVFRNAHTDSINVMYRRNDGHLGLIEPEA
jgi:putative sigma-54 modulation protein